MGEVFNLDDFDNNQKTGRPTDFTPEIKSKILNEISTTTKSSKKICLDLGLDYSCFKRMKAKDDVFNAMYVRAKQDQAEEIYEEAMEVSRDTSFTRDEISMAEIQQRRLQVDTMKWAAAKLYPKFYGDKVISEVEVTHKAISSKDEFKKVLEAIKKEKQLNSGEDTIKPNDEYIDYTEEKRGE